MGLYACTFAVLSIGLELVKENHSSDQLATIYTLWCWIARYDCPVIIGSDQGTHFITFKIQRWFQTTDIQWNFHFAYNPTAVGNIKDGIEYLKPSCYNSKIHS